MKKFLLSIVLGLSLISSGVVNSGCALFTTHVSAVADVANAGGKIEATANQIFTAAKTANAATPPIISRAALDTVAIAVNKIGHLGVYLANALEDYNAAKDAGKDLTAQKAVVNKILLDLNSALKDIGTAIPEGTLKEVDKLASSIFDIMTQVKAGVGL